MNLSRHLVLALALLVALCGIVGCRRAQKEPRPGQTPAPLGTWVAQEIGAITNLDGPESVAIDPAGNVYVSNAVATNRSYWDEDGNGFISLLDASGAVKQLRMIEGTRNVPLSGPKGLCIVGAYLWVADNTRVARFPLVGTAAPHILEGVTGRRLNDIATDGKFVYVSDTAAGKILKIGLDGKLVATLFVPQGINGITFAEGKMFGVSWSLREVYELDPEGKAEAIPFGLARQFRSLDGIQVLGDGTFVVSDYVAGKVLTISPNRRTVATLVKVGTPADIGIDRKRNRLYVPQMEHNRLIIYQLEKK